MGEGALDLHESAATGHYYDIFDDPRDDEAPVWGYRRASRWSRMSGENRAGILVMIALCFVVALLAGAFYYVDGRNLPSFSVRLAGYEGIDPGRPGRVVSPAFKVTVRLNKTCVDRADVIVTYSGVALGWARAEPWDCEGKRWARDVEVLARGDGVGLSRRLRDRMASEWRSGVLELNVDVGIFDNSGGRRAAGDFPQKVMTCKVKLDGQKSETLPFAWYALDIYTYDYRG